MAHKKSVKKLFKKRMDAEDEDKKPRDEDALDAAGEGAELPDKAPLTPDVTRKVLGTPDRDSLVDKDTGRDARYEYSGDSGTGATSGANLLERGTAVEGDPRLVRPDQAELDEARRVEQDFRDAGNTPEPFAIEGLDDDAPAEASDMESAVSRAAWKTEPHEWTGGGGYTYKYKPAINGQHTTHSTIEITDREGNPVSTIDPSSEHFVGILQEVQREGDLSHVSKAAWDKAAGGGAPESVKESQTSGDSLGEPLAQGASDDSEEAADIPGAPEGFTQQDADAWEARAAEAPAAPAEELSFAEGMGKKVDESPLGDALGAATDYLAGPRQTSVHTEAPALEEAPEQAEAPAAPAEELSFAEGMGKKVAESPLGDALGAATNYLAGPRQTSISAPAPATAESVGAKIYADATAPSEPIDTTGDPDLSSTPWNTDDSAAPEPEYNALRDYDAAMGGQAQEGGPSVGDVLPRPGQATLAESPEDEQMRAEVAKLMTNAGKLAMSGHFEAARLEQQEAEALLAELEGTAPVTNESAAAVAFAKERGL